VEAELLGGRTKSSQVQEELVCPIFLAVTMPALARVEIMEGLATDMVICTRHKREEIFGERSGTMFLYRSFCSIE
jgi:hypothetical protein